MNRIQWTALLSTILAGLILYSCSVKKEYQYQNYSVYECDYSECETECVKFHGPECVE